VDSGGSRDAARRLPVARSDRWATVWASQLPGVSGGAQQSPGGSQLPGASGGPQQSPGGSQLPGASGGQPGSPHEVAGSTAAVETPQSMGDARRRQIHPPDPLTYPRDQTHAAARALKLHKKPRPSCATGVGCQICKKIKRSYNFAK
jgi:hypothetical protein